MESIIYGIAGVIVGIVVITAILYIFVNVGSWTVRTFSQIWNDIINKGYYDIFLPVYSVVKWLWIIPHKVLKGLGLYYLSAFIYRVTVRNFSIWLENRLKAKVTDFKNGRKDKKEKHQEEERKSQQEQEKQGKKEEQKQESREEPKREQPKKSPYEILGVPQTATLEEIKRAYRDQSQQYHPDKVNHLGEELKEVANRKFKEINQAYQALKRLHE